MSNIWDALDNPDTPEERQDKEDAVEVAASAVDFVTLRIDDDLEAMAYLSDCEPHLIRRIANESLTHIVRLLRKSAETGIASEWIWQAERIDWNRATGGSY